MELITQNYRGNPKWNICGLFILDNVYFSLFELLEKNNLDNPIDYIYGSPKIFADGGRNVDHQYDYSLDEHILIMQKYIDFNKKIKLTFSNHLMDKSDYKNKLLNCYLSFLNDNNNEHHIIITDDNFRKYIRKNYPNLLLTSSIIKPALEVGWGNETINYYNDLCEKYDTVVINVSKALDTDFIKYLRFPEKLEVIVNSRCELNCPLAKEHYSIVASSIKYKNDINLLNNIRSKEAKLFEQCLENHKKNIISGSNLSHEQIQQLLDNNISNFKLEGRQWQNGVILRDLGTYIFDNQKLTNIYTVLFNESV